MLRIKRHFADEMIAHAIQDDPNECCGILAGRDGEFFRLYRISNTEQSPYRYMMDPLEQLRAERDAEANGLEFLAFYHSHTHGPAYPSATDVRMALQSGWLNVYYLLVSLMDRSHPQVRAFCIGEDGQVREEALSIE